MSSEGQNILICVISYSTKYNTMQHSTAQNSTVQLINIWDTLCISKIHTVRSSAVVVLRERSTKLSIQQIHTNTTHTYMHACIHTHRKQHTLALEALIPKQQTEVRWSCVYTVQLTAYVISCQCKTTKPKRRVSSSVQYYCFVYSFDSFDFFSLTKWLYQVNYLWLKFEISC